MIVGSYADSLSIQKQLSDNNLCVDVECGLTSHLIFHFKSMYSFKLLNFNSQTLTLQLLLFLDFYHSNSSKHHHRRVRLDTVCDNDMIFIRTKDIKNMIIKSLEIVMANLERTIFHTSILLQCSMDLQ